MILTTCKLKSSRDSLRLLSKGLPEKFRIRSMPMDLQKKRLAGMSGPKQCERLLSRYEKLRGGTR